MTAFLRQSRAALKRGVGSFSQKLMFVLCISFVGAACLAPAGAIAQNHGTTPAVGQAIQGQTASQPEGAFLNVVNWIGNVICPVGAGLAVVGTVSLIDNRGELAVRLVRENRFAFCLDKAVSVCSCTDQQVVHRLLCFAAQKSDPATGRERAALSLREHFYRQPSRDVRLVVGTAMHSRPTG